MKPLLMILVAFMKLLVSFTKGAKDIENKTQHKITIKEYWDNGKWDIIGQSLILIIAIVMLCLGNTSYLLALI